MATLRILGGEEGEQTIELAEGVVQIGRARDNDIVLTGAEKGVSRVHAELRFENDRYVIVDLQSQNGTWVNGRRVERAEVGPGAEIALGEYRLTLQRDGAPGPAAPKPASPVVTADDLRLREPAVPVARVAAAPSGASTGLIAAAVVGIVVVGGGAAVWLSRSAGRDAVSAVAPVSTPAASPAPAPASDPAPAEKTGASPEPAPPEAGGGERRPVAVAPGPTAAARVARKPGESVEAWRSRSAALQTRYGYSKAAMERGDYAAAAGGFEAILLEEPGFLDTAQLLVQAHSGLRGNARTLHRAGQRLESNGDWLGALQKFEQARQIYSGMPGIADDIRRMKEQLRTAGTNAFIEAKAHEEAGRIDAAVKAYEKAVQWLPADDPNRQIARSRIEQLKKS